MAKICLVTPAQPSTNPRLVKEADALTEAGHDVHVIYAHVNQWADEADKALLGSRTWKRTRVGGHPTEEPLMYRITRRRYRLAHRIMGMGLRNSILDGWLSDRVMPELKRAAQSFHADLYIGHNTAALPAVTAAARRNRAKCGFDIEDYFSGMHRYDDATNLGTNFVERIESGHLGRCDYLTVVSPEVGEVYRGKYGVETPQVILNVFPMARRPAEWRPCNHNGPLTLYWVSQTIGDERLDNVVRVMGLLRECNIELHVRGNWGARYQEKLLKLAESCGVPKERIISLAVRPADEMVGLAAAFDIGLVLETNATPFNDLCLTNKIFTYILAGNAVVTTATKAHKRIATEIGAAAFCFEMEDVKGLSERLHHWYLNRSDLDVARRRAWELGGTRYNWESEQQKFLDVVKGVLSA